MKCVVRGGSSRGNVVDQAVGDMSLLSDRRARPGQQSCQGISGLRICVQRGRCDEIEAIPDMGFAYLEFSFFRQGIPCF
jgi:hypothetical protein